MSCFEKKNVCIPRSFLVINVCNQEKNLCSLCMYMYMYVYIYVCVCVCVCQRMTKTKGNGSGRNVISKNGRKINKNGHA